MFFRVILITVVLSYLFYIVNTKILHKEISISKSATIILLITIAIYIILGILSYFIN